MKSIKRIYLIDDDELFVYLLSRTIEATKLVENIEIFNNGQDAIEFLKENTDKEEILPEIIFLDLSMPILDGWGFLDEYLFIKPKLNKKIELFILSSSVSPHDVERAKKNLDVSDFIIKPMSKKGFIHIIEQM